MQSTGLNKRLVDSYFHLLQNLDNEAKEALIIKLTESLAISKPKGDLSGIAGAWEDSRSAEEIIEELRNDRVNKTDLEPFE